MPKVFHFDESLALTVMAYLKPHIILRKGLIRGTVYPRLADHMATFMAETLFSTSDLGQPAADEEEADGAVLRQYRALPRSPRTWSSPIPGGWPRPTAGPARSSISRRRRCAADGPWKRAAQELKLKFLGEAQALIHGDLHSGSIMVTESETYAIDPEFAFYGPMGFDIGALLGNLYLAFFAQSGHEAKTGARDDYRDWILATAEQVFTLFDRRFRALWNGRHASETFAPGLFAERRRPGGAQGRARMPICAACSSMRWASPAAR